MRRFDREAWANTWVVLTSDHGDMQGDHNLWRKTYPYEGSSRIPLLVVPPPAVGRPARPVAQEVVGLQDVMPALLEATGLPLPNTIDGQSLLPLLTSPAELWREYLHGEHCTCYSQEQEMQYVTDGRRKLIWLPRVGLEQFFDLEADPGECRNLVDAPERLEEVTRWHSYLLQALSERDCGWVKDGSLHCPEGEPLVSPYRDVRWPGPTESRSESAQSEAS
jgi:arylsulfatase A-like enzyme